MYYWIVCLWLLLFSINNIAYLFSFLLSEWLRWTFQALKLLSIYITEDNFIFFHTCIFWLCVVIQFKIQNDFSSKYNLQEVVFSNLVLPMISLKKQQLCFVVVVVVDSYFSIFMNFLVSYSISIFHYISRKWSFLSLFIFKYV